VPHALRDQLVQDRVVARLACAVVDDHEQVIPNDYADVGPVGLRCETRAPWALRIAMFHALHILACLRKKRRLVTLRLLTRVLD
jgi:hypothetical protein